MGRIHRRTDRLGPLLEGEISRSQLKRESTATQKIGEELTTLSDSALKSLNLPSEVLDAVLEWHRLPTREAKRRQLQFIGRLMRDVDEEAIAEAIATTRMPEQASATLFHELEALRERLLEEGPAAVDEVLTRWPHADRQQFRQLVRNAQAERKANRPPRVFKQLFKALRELEATAVGEEEY